MLKIFISELRSQLISNTKEMIIDRAVYELNVKLIKQNSTFLSFKLSIVKVTIASKDSYTNEAIAELIPL